MNPKAILILILGVLTGCPYTTALDDAGKELSDIKCSPLPDLLLAPPKCSAAKNLSGDNLLCVDFSQVVSLTDPRLSGWDFVSNCGGNNWEIMGGNLQIKIFDQFTGTCGFKLPSIDLMQSQYSQYNSITLALRHKVDLDLGITNPNQLARVYLGTANPASLVTTLSETQIEQQITLSIDKQNLLPALNNVYQWLLQISSFQKQNKQGWQISSIAIMGNT